MATHDVGIVDTMRRRVIELEHGHLVRDQARGGLRRRRSDSINDTGVPAISVRAEGPEEDEASPSRRIVATRGRRGQR